MVDQKAPAWRASNAVAEWLAGKDPAELDVVEMGGRRLYPDSIKRRGGKSDPGAVVEVPILLRVPSSADKALARLDALRWARELAKEAGAKAPEQLTIAAAESLLGAAYFDELDTKCILARCMFEVDPPHTQYLLYSLLDGRHDHASLLEVWDRLCFYTSWEDPRVSDVDAEQFAAIVAAIDRARNLSPFVAIDGSARDSCVISMASRLQICLTGKCCSQSTETSTPQPTSATES